jgi:hypothetical protein
MRSSRSAEISRARNPGVVSGEPGRATVVGAQSDERDRGSGDPDEPYQKMTRSCVRSETPASITSVERRPQTAGTTHNLLAAAAVHPVLDEARRSPDDLVRVFSN